MSHTPIGDIPRYLAENKESLPYMTIVITRGQNGLYHAWQPEFSIVENAETMDDVILRVTATMGELITSEEFDYLQTKQGEVSYYVPFPMLPEDLAADKNSLMEMLKIVFPITDLNCGSPIFYISAQPSIP